MMASEIAISASEFRWLEKSSLSCNFCVSLWPNSSSYRNTSTLDLVRTFLDPQTMWWTPKLTLYDKQWLIYCSSNAKAAILDAILKITSFRKLDFLRFLVCYSGHRILQKTVEKPFVAIFLGLNSKLTRLRHFIHNIS